METVPLTLNILHLTPTSLIPSTTAPPSHLPPTALPAPPPPQGFAFSPTPNYPSPFGTISLGSRLELIVALENTHRQRYGILGVKMMIEIQTPAGRYRLGEVIHGKEALPSDPKQLEKERAEPAAGEDLPELPWGETVELAVEGEMKDLGLGVVIVSVAWETLDGRRTLQRFFKFNVITPLGIKTRIQNPAHPNTVLDAGTREKIYLEVFMQNTSSESMRIIDIELEPIGGLLVEKIDSDGETGIDLGVDGTRQYLFVLSPSPRNLGGKQSSFPPDYPSGAILPLGRLSLGWIAGPYHTPGKLLTSMLNRRVPLAPPSNLAPRPQPVKRPSAVLPSPSKSPGPAGRDLMSPAPLLYSGVRGQNDIVSAEIEWVYDLVLQGSRTVSVETEFTVSLRLAIQSSLPVSDCPSPPSLPRLGIQYLTHVPVLPTTASPVTLAISPPSRSATPISPSLTAGSVARPFSPLTPAAGKDSERQAAGGAASRPMTPIRSELRSAVGTLMRPGSPMTTTPALTATAADGAMTINEEGSTWPPAPTIVPNPAYKPSISLSSPLAIPVSSTQADQRQDQGSAAQLSVKIHHLGPSLSILSLPALSEKVDNLGVPLSALVPSADIENEKGQVEDKARTFWETEVEWEWSFIGFEEGLGVLGGLRVLLLKDGEGGAGEEGEVAKEWDCLGDIFVT